MGALREYRSIRSGASGLPYYYTPIVCISVVFELLAVWRYNNPKTENQKFVSSFVNMILTRQTCGQRSSRAAESKRRALGNYFSERICYVFLISKCRGDRNLGLWTTSGLAFGEPWRCGNLQENPVFRRRKNWILPLKIFKIRFRRFSLLRV